MKKLLTEKTIISSCSLISSLATYYYGKAAEKDVVPYVMIGGFVGAWVGEIIVRVNRKEQ